MDLDTVKTRLQQHLSDGIVIIVGSGLSCAEGLPGMGELAGHLCAAIGTGLDGDDASAWAVISPLIASMPTSALMSAITCSRSAPLLGGGLPPGLVRMKLRRGVASVMASCSSRR